MSRWWWSCVFSLFPCPTVQLQRWIRYHCLWWDKCAGWFFGLSSCNPNKVSHVYAAVTLYFTGKSSRARGDLFCTFTFIALLSRGGSPSWFYFSLFAECFRFFPDCNKYPDEAFAAINSMQIQKSRKNYRSRNGVGRNWMRAQGNVNRKQIGRKLWSMGFAIGLLRMILCDATWRWNWSN